eukprot:1161698-Pelagomonas_calceolata.AAC.14
MQRQTLTLAADQQQPTRMTVSSGAGSRRAQVPGGRFGAEVILKVGAVEKDTEVQCLSMGLHNSVLTSNLVMSHREEGALAGTLIACLGLRSPMEGANLLEQTSVLAFSLGLSGEALPFRTGCTLEGTANALMCMRQPLALEVI